MTVHRLLYTSRSVVADEDEARQAAGAIARRAAENNVALGLTGALLFVRGTYIQALEGPLAEVELVFERICRDLRHEDLRLWDVSQAHDRLFGDWSMAFLAQEDGPVRLRRYGDLDDIRFTAGVNAREAMRQMRHALGQGIVPTVAANR